jgi:A/G-specific adenine glycosylase
MDVLRSSWGSAVTIATRTDTAAAAFRSKLVRWGKANYRSFPWRETNDPFRILVAEVLLQRSRGVTVAMVYEELFARWPDAEHLARARTASIQSVIRPLGLVRRAATLRELARAVVARGSVPDTLEDLLELPGVGPYAAGATLAVAFDRRSPVVDGVTARVYRRYFGLPEGLPAVNDPALWALVRDVTPRTSVKRWNWAVLDLAATVCLPKVPRCDRCALATDCLRAADLRSSMSG